VLRAHQRALALLSIPRRARSALAAIALTVSTDNPLGSVFARRKYLAKRAGISERTWYRAEEDLVNAGFIAVEEQKRKKRGGQFGSAYIYLSRTVAEALGFFTPVGAAKVNSPAVVSAPSSLPAPEQNKTREPAVSEATESSSDQPTATLSDRSVYRFYQSPLLQKRQPGSVPEDVQPLLDLGFHRNYIWKLMKIARTQYGKRLGDIVAVAGDFLRQAKDPRSYLWALLRSNSDFGYQARAKAAAESEKAHRVVEDRELAELQKRIAGSVFYNAGGTKRYEVSTNGKLLTSQDIEEAGLRTAAGHWIRDFARALNAQKILRATPELEARYSELRSVSAAQAAHKSVLPAAEPRVRTHLGLNHLASLAAVVGARRPVVAKQGVDRQ
ncbi:helix-turn-helix domain-containing protein, partial [Ralstonia sp. ASV6]|uniref:helix-turn-helix domain-containing protein n=1 Tax=Ralstonia sp. ASV6 TaxID=2795124 RepID=UPI001E5780E0